MHPMLQRNAGRLSGIVGATTILGSVLAGGGELRSLRLAGALVGLAALPLFVLPFRQLRRFGRSREGESYMDTTAVADRGLYRVVRHPQYLAYSLLMVAFALLAQHPLVVGTGVVGVALFYLAAVAEEAELRERFGGSYGRYAEGVPRFNLVAGIWRLVRRR